MKLVDESKSVQDTVCSIYKCGIRRVTISNHKRPEVNGVYYEFNYWQLTEDIKYMGLSKYIGLARPLLIVDPSDTKDTVDKTLLDPNNSIRINELSYIHIYNDLGEPYIMEDYDVFSEQCDIKEEFLFISKIVSSKEEFVL